MQKVEIKQMQNETNIEGPVSSSTLGGAYSPLEARYDPVAVSGIRKRCKLLLLTATSFSVALVLSTNRPGETGI